jgi:hypothetical protein
MYNIIQSDFNVSPLHSGKNTHVFVGIRENHFHFINYQKTNGGASIYQFHSLRKGFAYCCNSIMHMSKMHPSSCPMSMNVTQHIRVILLEPDNINVLFLDVDDLQFKVFDSPNKSFKKTLLADLSLSKKGCGNQKERKLLSEELKITLKDECWEEHEELTSTVFFNYLNAQKEGRTFKKKTLENCLIKILSNNFKVSSATVNKIANHLHFVKTYAQLDSETSSLLKKLDKELFDNFFFHQEDLSIEQLSNKVKEAIQQLSPLQVLLVTELQKGCSPLFHFTLGYLNELISHDEFIDFVCAGFQPDSKEEQKARQVICDVQYLIGTYNYHSINKKK